MKESDFIERLLKVDKGGGVATITGFLSGKDRMRTLLQILFLNPLSIRGLPSSTHPAEELWEGINVRQTGSRRPFRIFHTAKCRGENKQEKKLRKTARSTFSKEKCPAAQTSSFSLKNRSGCA